MGGGIDVFFFLPFRALQRIMSAIG